MSLKGKLVTIAFFIFALILTLYFLLGSDSSPQLPIPSRQNHSLTALKSVSGSKNKPEVRLPEQTANKEKQPPETASFQEPWKTISGEVYDLEGAPIENVEVIARGYPMNSETRLTDGFFETGKTIKAITNKDGEFQFEVAKMNRYALLLRKEGYSNIKKPVEPGQHYLFALLPSEKPVCGRVVDSSTRLPVHNAQIEVKFSSGGRYANVTKTDKEGKFYLESLPHKTDFIFITHEKYEILNLYHYPTCELNGKTWELKPIPETTVYLICRSSLDKSIFKQIFVNGMESIADGEGRHKMRIPSFVNPLFAEKNVTIKANGFFPYTLLTEENMLSEGQLVEVELSPSARGWGMVIDIEGNAVPKVKVTVVDKSYVSATVWEKTVWEKELWSSITDEKGIFSFDCLPVESLFDLEFSIDEQFFRRRDSFKLTQENLASNDNFLGTITLEEYGELKGEVVDCAGNPIPGSYVSVGRPHIGAQKGIGQSEKKYLRTLTDEFGRFSIRVDKFDSLYVSKKGFLRFREKKLVEIEPNGEVLQRIVLTKSASITGRVVDAANKPVPGAVLTVHTYSDRSKPRTQYHGTINNKTDMRGRFELVGFEPGKRYGLAAFRDYTAGGRVSEIYKEFVAGEEDVILPVTEVSHLLVEIRDIEGKYITGRGIYVYSNRQERQGRGRGRGCRSGVCSELLLPGDWRISVVAPGYREFSTELYLEPRETKQIPVTLHPAEEEDGK